MIKFDPIKKVQKNIKQGMSQFQLSVISKHILFDSTSSEKKNQVSVGV